MQLMLLLFFVWFFFFFQKQTSFLVLLINLNICLCMCAHIIFCFSIRWHQILLFIIQRSFELYNLLRLFKINLLFLKKIRKIFLCVFFNALLSSSTLCRSVIVTSLTNKLDYRKSTDVELRPLGATVAGGLGGWNSSIAGGSRVLVIS